jgi:hypothetical protein
MAGTLFKEGFWQIATGGIFVAIFGANKRAAKLLIELRSREIQPPGISQSLLIKW